MIRRGAAAEVALLTLLGAISACCMPELVAEFRGRSASPAGVAVLGHVGWLFGAGWIVLAAVRAAIELLLPHCVGERGGSAEADSPKGPTFTQWLLMLSPAAFVLVGGLWIADRSLAYDEILAWHLDVVRPYPDALLPHGVFANHLLATTFAKLAVIAGEQSERAVRSAFVLPVALAVAWFSWVAWRVGGRARVGWFAGALLALHPLVWSPGLQVRGYGLSLLGGVLLAIPWLPDDHSGHGIAERYLPLIGGLIAGLSHFFGFVFVALNLLAMLAMACMLTGGGPGESQGRRRRIALQLYVALGVAWCAWLPSLPWLFHVAGGAPSGTSEGARFLDAWAGLLTGGSAKWPQVTVAAIVTAIAVRGLRELAPLRAWSAAGLALVAVSGIGAAMLSPTFYFARFLSVALPCWIVCAVFGWRGPRALGWTVAIVLLIAEGRLSRLRVADSPNLRGAMAEFERSARTGAARWCTESSAEKAMVLRHYAYAELEECAASEAQADHLDARGWLVLGGLPAQKPTSAGWLEDSHQMRVFRVGGSESDVVAWIPKVAAEASSLNSRADGSPP